MPNTNHMQGESMYFEELNVPQNHIYLFKPHFLVRDGRSMSLLSRLTIIVVGISEIFILRNIQ